MLNAQFICYLKEQPRMAMEALINDGMDPDLAFAVVEALCQGKDEALFELPEE